MDLAKEHQKVVEALKKGGSEELNYNDTELEQFIQSFDQALEEKDFSKLAQAVLISFHFAYPSQPIGKRLLKILSCKEAPELLIIDTLASAHKHIITFCSKTGHPLPTKLTTVLGHWIQKKEAEMQMWVLKTLDLIGPEGSKPFKKMILNNRPPFLKTVFLSKWREPYMLSNEILGRIK